MTDFESVKRFLNQFHSLAGIKMELDYFIKNGTYFFKKVCNSKRRAEKLLLNIKKAENVVIDAIGELNPCERKVVTELIIKNKSRSCDLLLFFISGIYRPR